MTHEVQVLEIEEEQSRGARASRGATPLLLAWAFFLFTAVAMGADVAADLAVEATGAHVALEVLIAVASLGGVAWFHREWRRERALARRAAAALASAVDESQRWRAEADRWRAEAREALDGLGDAIDTQFGRWELTAAESEVALLLLKGLSHKEVADLRGVSERTARQQSLAVYRKAGVAGRAELSAFFLEDLLVPRAATVAGPRAPGAAEPAE